MNEIFPDFLSNNELLATQITCMNIVQLTPNVEFADTQLLLQLFEYNSTHIWDLQSGDEKESVFCT